MYIAHFTNHVIFSMFFALFIWLLKWMWFCGNQQMSPRRLQIGRYTQFGDGEGWKAIAAINIKFDPWEANKKIGVISQVNTKAVKIQTGIFLNYYVVTGQPLQPYRVGLTSLFQPTWQPNGKDLDDCLDIPQNPGDANLHQVICRRTMLMKIHRTMILASLRGWPNSTV